ncbi:MAG: hypothetical protein ACYTGW_15130 [Planctomycetota bacterium]|jgi:hypothetical protein
MNLHTNAVVLATAATLTTLTFFAGCSSGGGGSGDGGSTPDTLGAVLQKVEYGRLVDIYSYRRTDPTRADRRDTLHRVPTLVTRDVVVRPDLETDRLFDVTGGEVVNAHYRFLPFDVSVGHTELLILWDDTVPGEKDDFEVAVWNATNGLPELSPAFRDQDPVTRPIPVIPRNAALKLTFDKDLGVDSAFYGANPNVLQLLEFIDRSNQTLFRPVRTRILADGSNAVVIDTSLLGGEANGGMNSTGMPPSPDNVRANLRLAIPTSGVAAKQLLISKDNVPELNGIDSRGDDAVIRDFRSGNLSDGSLGALADVEAPMVVGHIGVGIVDIDFEDRVLTLNKRFANVAIRARVPFVDGAIDVATNLPGGPGLVPTTEPLRSGDVLLQEVISAATGERITIRAEILENLAIVSHVTNGKLQGVGQAAEGGDDGNQPTARVRVASLTALDSQGNPVSFEKSDLPLGADATVKVHYYENVPFDQNFGNTSVSDAGRRAEFLAIDPEPPALDANRKPLPPATQVDPTASISLRFSEPMDLLTGDPTKNFFLTNHTLTDANVATLINEPKPMSLAIVAARLVDESGDGTLLRLSPPLGHFHKEGDTESYWFHMMLDATRLADLSANTVDIFDRTLAPIASFSVRYSLDDAAESNFVGYRVFRFEALDEDGSTGGSFDCDGQVTHRDGRIFGLATTRFSRVADGQNLSAIVRNNRGECWTAGTGTPPGPPTPATAIPLYACPSQVVTVAPDPSFPPPPGGYCVEPHQPRGSKLQMTYREDDFGLSYTNRAHFLLDIEQMHWAPFNEMPVRFDVFDRYTLRMAHCEVRPDVHAVGGTGTCGIDLASLRSGLQPGFQANVLDGTDFQDVVKDAKYEINPTNTFKTITDTTMIPYPKFQSSYVWRDTRLVSWDMATDRAIGLGGAHDADTTGVQQKTTASISSPWVPDKPPAALATLFQSGDYVRDAGDFVGFRNEDHNPIALPLLMQFSIHPDDATNGFASGVNRFHIALVGPCFPSIFHGFYNVSGFPGASPTGWGHFRAHVSGGPDPITGQDIFVNPSVETRSRASWVKDILLGNPFQTVQNGRDDHVHWAQADFARRVSELTFGFWDTLQPNRHDFLNLQWPVQTSWPGRNIPQGIPDLTTVSQQAGIKDFAAIMDPPLVRQPAGTNLVVEYRGAKSFDNDDKLFAQQDDASLTRANIVQQRGNLLNPSYAQEAYRYAMENRFPTTYFNVTMPATGPRVAATGLTPYVSEDGLDSLRDETTGLLPRFLNFRFVMTNNLAANPPLQPFLNSFQIAYRVK